MPNCHMRIDKSWSYIDTCVTLMGLVHCAISLLAVMIACCRGYRQPLPASGKGHAFGD